MGRKNRKEPRKRGAGLWKDGKVTDFAIRSPVPRQVKVRVNGEVKTVVTTGE